MPTGHPMDSEAKAEAQWLNLLCGIRQITSLICIFVSLSVTAQAVKRMK